MEMVYVTQIEILLSSKLGPDPLTVEILYCNWAGGEQIGGAK